MRRACIDIGSNTTRLLVAETDGHGLSTVHEERAFTRIGAALAGGDTIPAATCAEVARVVAGQVARARALGVADIRGVATAAVRIAVNGPALVARIGEVSGLRVAVLSEREEARLAFRGASGMLAGAPPPRLGVVDVGGGSSEVIVGDPGGEIDWWVSLPLGSSSLAATHLRHDPPTDAELAAARVGAADACACVELDGPPPPRVVAVGGSATSLGRLVGARLHPAALASALRALCAAPAEAVAARHGIDVERVRLLPAGLIVLAQLAGRLGGEIEVGRGGIREGVLLEAIAR